MTADTAQASLIAVDWGTSRLRARLLAPDLRVLAVAESDEGIGRIEGNHEAIFERLCADWPAAPAIMAGMIGSRQGWREAAYVPCPTTPQALAGAMTRFTTARGRPVAIVPGLKETAADRDFDVIRGEETQMAGLIDREPGFTGLCILPGTHSKWARIEGGTIVSFQTFITGELFELLSKTSFLRHSVASGGDNLSGTADFRLGVERTGNDRPPFLAALFSVRARQLLGGVDPQANLAYLSGLVIGGEIAAGRHSTDLQAGATVRIVASGTLGDAYRSALAVISIAATAIDGDALVLDGLARLAREIGFLPAVKA